MPAYEVQHGYSRIRYEGDTAEEIVHLVETVNAAQAAREESDLKARIEQLEQENLRLRETTVGHRSF